MLDIHNWPAMSDKKKIQRLKAKGTINPRFCKEQELYGLQKSLAIPAQPVVACIDKIAALDLDVELKKPLVKCLTDALQVIGYRSRQLTETRRLNLLERRFKEHVLPR